MYKWLKCKIYQILLCFLSDMYIGIQYIVCGNFVCLESVHNFPNYCFGLCMFLVHIFLNSHRLGYYPRPLSVCKLWYIRATETHIFKTTYNMGMDFQKGTFQKGASVMDFQTGASIKGNPQVECGLYQFPKHKSHCEYTVQLCQLSMPVTNRHRPASV